MTGLNIKLNKLKRITLITCVLLAVITVSLKPGTLAAAAAVGHRSAIMDNVFADIDESNNNNAVVLTTTTPPKSAAVNKGDDSLEVSDIASKSVNAFNRNNYPRLSMAEFLEGMMYKQWNLTDKITFTLIHGRDAQQRNQTEAERFCQRLGKTVALKDKEYVLSHLVSLHGPHFTRELMNFVLSNEHRRFWTGGRITKFKRFNRPAHFYLQWSDKTLDDFRDLAEPAKDLSHMRPDETRCLYIGYTNGRLSVAPDCGMRMNFVCQTRVVDPEAIRVADLIEQKHQEDEFFHGVRRRGNGKRLLTKFPPQPRAPHAPGSPNF